MSVQIQDRYRLELQELQKMKLSSCTKKLIGKIKNRENVLSLELVEVVIQIIVTPNKFYSYLLNVKSSNLAFLKTYNFNL